jgi:hypothetical protein
MVEKVIGIIFRVLEAFLNSIGSGMGLLNTGSRPDGKTLH